MNRGLRVSSALLALATSGTALAADDLVLTDIALRPGVTVDVHLNVYDNTHAPCRSGTLLAIHGAAATANSLDPLANAIADLELTDRPVCHVVVMDLPGHGEGSLPDGALFGELTLDDYATAVIATLDRLGDEGLRPTTIAGHSMGGLTVQVVQDRLLAQGTSLWDAFHVGHAILLAPALPDSVPWAFRDTGAGAAMMVFVTTDPVLGDVLAFPPALWPAVAFMTLDGTIAVGSQSGEELAAAGMVGPESMGACGPMFGLDAYPAIDVAEGIFAEGHGTRLDIVAFEQDTTITPADLELLFPYLTGESPDGPGYLLIEGSEVSHGYPISHPDELLGAFEGAVSLP